MTQTSALNTIEKLLNENKRQEALREYDRLMQNAGDQYDLWVNYASFLHRCGQYAEAVKIAEKSIAIKPSLEGYHNLGCALRECGKLNEAISAFKKVIFSNPDFHQGHNEIATAYERVGQIVFAIDHYQIATTLDPKNTKYWLNLARSRMAAGRNREALSAVRAAHKIDGHDDNVLRAYAQVFQSQIDQFDITPELLTEIESCLRSSAVNPKSLTKIAHALYGHQIVVKTLLEYIEDYRIKNLDEFLNNKNLNWGVLVRPLFIEILEKLSLDSPSLEIFFTAMRYHLMDALAKETPNQALIKPLYPFIAALACQCFINEFLFFESMEEKKLVLTLRERIQKNPDSATPEDVAMLACYQPLFELSCANQLLKKFSNDKVLKTLIRLQIEEPLAEEKIKKSLKNLTSIDDETSKLVKAQYEINPYPRWVHLAQRTPNALNINMKFMYPYLQDSDFKTLNIEEPEILLAGCGTGKHPLEVSMNFKHKNILAIDLSAASLAYAVRKTQELQVKGIEYGIGDILKLSELEKKFDVVFCGGVLHHMKDPMQGWRALTDCLKPGGFMMIALYSELARKSVVAARSFIAEQKYSSDIDGIRACREAIKAMPAHNPIRAVMNWSDFFSISACRDLLFHVQEHRYTPLLLKKSIENLGLEFLGFQFTNPVNLKRYVAVYPNDPRGRNLENWDDFERQNPETFVEMYHFWLRKPI